MTSESRRISKQEIVKPAPVVLSKKSLDSVFTKDNSDIVFTDEFGNVIKNAPLGAFNFTGSFGGVVTGPSGSSGPSGITGPETVPPDVPSLADIESITMEEYADSNGVSKYKAVIKIRNSSRDKMNVAGVDARVYNPNGSTSYNLGSGNASSIPSGATGPSGPSGSNYVSNTTWYQAKSLYNPISGTIYSEAYIVSNAQYLSDGSNVPKDTITGISSNTREKTAWRKTQTEAILAATPII